MWRTTTQPRLCCQPLCLVDRIITSLCKDKAASVTASPAALPSSKLVRLCLLHLAHIAILAPARVYVYTPPLSTAPCIPQDVTTYVQCESKVGSVSWGPSDGAESYIVTATGLDGHTHQCLTNTTSCTWNDLHCGEDYTVVVRAKDDNCTSLPSNSSVIHMGMLRNICSEKCSINKW